MQNFPNIFQKCKIFQNCQNFVTFKTLFWPWRRHFNILHVRTFFVEKRKVNWRPGKNSEFQTKYHKTRVQSILTMAKFWKKFFQKMQNFQNLYIFSIFSKMQIFPKFSKKCKIFEKLQNFPKICQIFPKFAKFSQKLSKSKFWNFETATSQSQNIRLSSNSDQNSSKRIHYKSGFCSLGVFFNEKRE